ncbi:Hsp70 family protein [Mycobacterium sp. SMC-4]|uniref:Hsp70 family protein n=1 Tax=Mycobacterium sp. SMC-4 TaxID=2857059 RepID=UPI0021B39AE5|nr:Hsp70 family protein [Mycobacterium sp. SMC-4]UXA17454.1 Hsp70 family protein [Mycobacterium sp. SMC-4]
MTHIGIDIGTSNTVVAIATQNGEPEVRGIKGHALVPSVIAVAEHGGNVVAGRDAVDEWANPDRNSQEIFRRWKLLMGDEKVFCTMRFGGPSSMPVDITPEYLTTRLVEYVLSEVTSGLGGENVDSVLITVPHGWRRDTLYKCQRTREAAGMAQVRGKPIEIQDRTISEPVAAAVYWLWEAQRSNGSPSASSFVGQNILVCDVGGGTFDLSLVRVGATGAAHVVVDAINNDFAGDYVTALIMARAAIQFNEKFNTSLPTDADEILRQLSDMPTAGLRSWFVELQQVQQILSDRIAYAARSGREARQKKTVVLSDSEDSANQLTFSMTPTDFVETLEPFYARGRELVRSFLRSHSSSPPYAVVFAGGGSRIAGIAEHIVGPALRAIYAVNVDDILNRIQINDHKIDQAIALGAALVASGTVRVEERVLCDIGLEVSLGADAAKRLKGEPGELVLMTPILAQGNQLPATFDSEDYRFFVGVPAGETVDLKIVIDDNLADPYILSWEEAIPPSAVGHHQCSVVVRADADGMLHVKLRYVDGYETNVQGKLARQRTGRSKKIVISGDEPTAGITAYRLRITPEQFAEALRQQRTGGRD